MLNLAVLPFYTSNKRIGQTLRHTKFSYFTHLAGCPTLHLCRIIWYDPRTAGGMCRKPYIVDSLYVPDSSAPAP